MIAVLIAIVAGITIASVADSIGRYFGKGGGE